jgi:hypothetical protein
VRPPIIRIAAAAAVLTCLAATASANALAGPHSPAAHRAAAAAPASAVALTLPDVGQVLVNRNRDGAGSVTLLSHRRGPAGLITMRADHQDYAIPLAALPYLGRGLDLSLFNLGALERAERGGRVPVTLHYRGHLGAMPGITVTRTGAGTAAGYLTARSADRLDGVLPGRTGLSIGLAGPLPAHPARASAKDRPVRVTVTGTGLSGQPTSLGDVQLSNVANGDTSTGTFEHGVARFRVQPGVYWAESIFYPPYPSARYWLRIDVLPQFTVAGSTTVHTSARAATSKVTLTTPRPAWPEFAGLTVVRNTQQTNNSLTAEALGMPLYVSPASRRRLDGQLRAFTFGQLLSPAGARVPYVYALDYANPPGTIAPQHFAATPANLATVTESYFQDRPSTADWWTYGGTRFQVYNSFIGSTATALRLPARQVRYLSGGKSMIWTGFYQEYPSDPAQSGGQKDTFRLVQGGEQLTENWGEYPLHPAGAVNIPGNYFWVTAAAIRQGNEISLDLAPFSDNQPGHEGIGAGTFTLAQNGVTIARGSTASTATATGEVDARVSGRPAKLEFVLRASRAGADYGLSASSVDEWTWHTRPEPGARIPAPWYCHQYGLSRRCAVQPLIMLDYAVAGMDLRGIVPAGRQAITVTARHLQLAAAPAVNSLRAQFSLNGGKTWQRAGTMDLGQGRFRVTFSAAHSAGVTLRITAADPAGSSLTETIVRAYQTAG